jgi:hypothetical protein
LVGAEHDQHDQRHEGKDDGTDVGADRVEVLDAALDEQRERLGSPDDRP